MGKHSTQPSKKPTLNSTMSKEKISATMSSHKLTQEKKKRHIKTRKSIQKLFQKLRDESQNNSIINLDDTTQSNTVIREDSIAETSFVIVDDEKVETPSNSSSQTPRRNVYQLPSHSTPNPKSRTSIDDLILNKSNAQLMHEEIINLTKEIRSDMSLTIDLTTEAENQTIIDLANTNNTTDNDCLFVTVSNASSMSGDSEITVLNMKNNNNSSPTSNNNRSKTNRDMQKFASGIANLNASEKGKLLELITQNIFNGCNVPNDLKTNLANIRQTITLAETATETVPESAEDTYIKQVILKQSRNSIGSNIYHPDKPINKTGLRMIVIDGSNVAMEHGRGRVFSVKGLKICIDYFLRKGHVVKAFVPRFRCKYGKSSEPRLLDMLERQGTVVYTPSREIQGRMITPYDDRYIVQCAAEFDGVIVSGDNYRDLIHENSRWRFVIENRLLPFTWVEDMIMFPKDPLGRNGPSLERFLKQ